MTQFIAGMTATRPKATSSSKPHRRTYPRPPRDYVAWRKAIHADFQNVSRIALNDLAFGRDFN